MTLPDFLFTTIFLPPALFAFLKATLVFAETFASFFTLKLFAFASFFLFADTLYVLVTLFLALMVCEALLFLVKVAL